MKKECCTVPSNLISIQERPDLRIDVCTECSCRHFVLKADPGSLGAMLSNLGSRPATVQLRSIQ